MSASFLGATALTRDGSSASNSRMASWLLLFRVLSRIRVKMEGAAAFMFRLLAEKSPGERRLSGGFCQKIVWRSMIRWLLLPRNSRSRFRSAST